MIAFVYIYLHTHRPNIAHRVEKLHHKHPWTRRSFDSASLGGFGKAYNITENGMSNTLSFYPNDKAKFPDFLRLILPRLFLNWFYTEF